MTKHTALLSACAALALLSGCSLLDPRQDPTRFFVLSPEAQADAASAAGDAEKTLIALGPVRLPDYLLRPELVRRSGPNQLEPSRVDRWGEPLDRAVSRVLCLDVAALLPNSQVVPFPAPAGEKPALQIEIDVTAFEADRAGATRLEARWRWRSGTRSVARAGTFERAAGSGETAAAVSAMSALLAELAQSIAADLGG